MHQQVIAFNRTVRARRTDLPELRTGDVVKVLRSIKEAGKERTQVFQGIVIAIKGGQSSSPTITVRKVSAGVGVELILPLASYQIKKIELIKRTRARRSKLYYVRSKSAKVISKKLKEVPFEIGRAGREVQDVVKEVTAAATVPAVTPDATPPAAE